MARLRVQFINALLGTKQKGFIMDYQMSNTETKQWHNNDKTTCEKPLGIRAGTIRELIRKIAAERGCLRIVDCYGDCVGECA